MLEIKFTEAAENDLVEARDWYEAESEGLGGRFVVEVRHQLALQLHLFIGSESMGDHDSEIVDVWHLNRDDA